MSKVKDAPKMQTAMKKINAMYKTEKYLPTKDNSINDAVAQMQVNEMKTVNVRVKELSQMVEKYLLSGGVNGNINPEIAEGKQVLPLKEVRTFVDTYNKHFLTNHKAEELMTEAKYVIGMQDASYFKGNEMMSAMKAGNTDKLDMHAGDGTITFTANNPGEVQRNAEKAIKDYINKETRNDRNALFAFNDLELEEVDGDGPTRQQEQGIKRVLDKYSNKAMFNTPSGKASGPLQKFADDESLEDMAVSGVM
jgi:hypothetical protein